VGRQSAAKGAAPTNTTNSIKELLRKRTELKVSSNSGVAEALRAKVPTKGLRVTPEPAISRAGSSAGKAPAANAFSRVPSAGTYADERAKAAETLRQTMAMLGKGKNSDADQDKLARVSSDPVAGATQAHAAGKAAPAATATESASERAKRLLDMARKSSAAESLLLGNIKTGQANRLAAQKESSATAAPEVKKVSLVSSDVLNSYNKTKTDTLAAQPAAAHRAKANGNFDNVLKRVASSDRPMSARTRKLLGLMPKNSAGNDILNPKTGAAKALSDMRQTKASIDETMSAMNEVLKNSGKLLANHFKGLNNKQLSDRIFLAFKTYDTSGDGLLQPEELIEALIAFGMDVDDDEVGAFCHVYGTNGELSPAQFETMVRISMGLENAESVAKEWAEAKDDGGGMFLRTSSAPDNGI